LREAYGERGLTQAELATLAGVSTALIDACERAQAIHRRRPPGLGSGIGTGDTPDEGEDAEPKKESRLRKATCACEPPFIIRVARKTLTDTSIRCESCGEAFRLS